MLWFRRVAPLLLLLLAFSPRVITATEADNRHWQEGEILSRKTIPPRHHHSRTHYLYRIKNGSVQYTARSDERLSFAPYTPLRFSVVHKHLFVQDEDGFEWKASILKKWIRR